MRVMSAKFAAILGSTAVIGETGKENKAVEIQTIHPFQNYKFQILQDLKSLQMTLSDLIMLHMTTPSSMATS